MADKDTHTDTEARSGATSRSSSARSGDEKKSTAGTEQSRQWNPATEGTPPKDRARGGDF